jgi:sensor domain CHASE-containing protein
MSFILRYLEIIFTVAGIAVIFGVTALFSSPQTSVWQVAAITAIVVGVIHGVLFWLVRRRQQHVRQTTITELQGMLKDIINNQLTVIQVMTNLREAKPEETKRACDYTSRSVVAISDALQHLSEESLRSWKTKYEHR